MYIPNLDVLSLFNKHILANTCDIYLRTAKVCDLTKGLVTSYVIVYDLNRKESWDSVVLKFG